MHYQQPFQTTYIRICVALQESDRAVIHALINGYAVVARCGKYQRLAGLQMLVELDTKDWCSMILLQVTPKQI